MVMQATTKSGERNKPEIRRPTQERGKQRYEDILNTVEVLLQDRDPSDIGIYDISANLGISPQSVYHFFLKFRSSLLLLQNAIWRRFVL